MSINFEAVLGSDDESGGGFSFGKLLVLVLVIVLVLGLLLPALGPVFLSLSNHASTGHTNRTWNAPTIQAYMEAGRCIPQQYLCPNGVLIMYCDRPDKMGEAIGLVINTITQVIITGYSAKTSYWQDSFRMCK